MATCASARSSARTRLCVIASERYTPSYRREGRRNIAGTAGTCGVLSRGVNGHGRTERKRDNHVYRRRHERGRYARRSVGVLHVRVMRGVTITGAEGERQQTRTVKWGRHDRRWQRRWRVMVRTQRRHKRWREVQEPSRALRYVTIHRP